MVSSLLLYTPVRFSFWILYFTVSEFPFVSRFSFLCWVPYMFTDYNCLSFMFLNIALIIVPKSLSANSNIEVISGFVSIGWYSFLITVIFFLLLCILIMFLLYDGYCDNITEVDNRESRLCFPFKSVDFCSARQLNYWRPFQILLGLNSSFVRAGEFQYCFLF